MVARRPRTETTAENRAKMVAAARRAFATSGYAEASMDLLAAEVGLTRGAIYHAFGGKLALLEAVVAQVDHEVAARAQRAAARAPDTWEGMLAEWSTHIEDALDPEVRRILLLDGPAFLGDPSGWACASACMERLRQTLRGLVAEGVIAPVNIEAVSRLLSGAAFNAALWVAASDEPRSVLPAAVEAFRLMARGLTNPAERVGRA